MNTQSEQRSFWDTSLYSVLFLKVSPELHQVYLHHEQDSRRSSSKKSNGNLLNMEQKRRSGRTFKQASKQQTKKEDQDHQINKKSIWEKRHRETTNLNLPQFPEKQKRTVIHWRWWRRRRNQKWWKPFAYQQKFISPTFFSLKFS